MRLLCGILGPKSVAAIVGHVLALVELLDAATLGDAG
jgi:hypothetical protein